MKFFENDKKDEYWKALTFEALPPPLPLEAFRGRLSQVYSNGRVDLLAAKALSGTELFELFSNDNWPYSRVATALWNEKPFASVVDAWELSDAERYFSSIDPYQLAATLARRYRAGGAYTSPGVSLSEAFGLAVPAVESVVTSPDCLILLSEAAWCGYFHDIAWDMTVLVADRRRLMITVLLATDTD